MASKTAGRLKRPAEMRPRESEPIAFVPLDGSMIDQATQLVWLGDQMTGEVSADEDFIDVLAELKMPTDSTHISAVRDALRKVEAES